MIFITVSAPIGRDIYVNGEYAASAGPAPVPLVLNPGSHVFETLATQAGSAVVDYANSVTDVPDLGSFSIALVAVHPPRPVVLPFGVALPTIQANVPTG
jgi:hypothetical protein